MTPEQIAVIAQTLPFLEQYGESITKAFYRNMLAAHPELKSVFNMTNQQNGHQAKVLAGALYAYGATLNNLDALGPMLELICHKHASLQITADQYDIVGLYLIKAMKEVLGDDFTPNVQDAWTSAYGQLASLMIQKESSLYGQHEEWKDWRDFRIVTIFRESEEISSFYLFPVDSKPLPTFVPGQYVSVRVYVPEMGYMQARQYSMSDIPSSKYYRISVKKERGQRFAPGVLSNALHDIDAPGEIVQVSHPGGDFLLNSIRERTPIVLIAGGVGITPLLSMLKFLTSTGSTVQRPVHLIYATRTTAARAFFKEIIEASRSDATARVTFFVEFPEASDKAGSDYHHLGRIDLQRLDAHRDLFLSDPLTEYYICGPSPFLKMVKNSLLNKRVKSSKIRMEVFGAGGFVETNSQARL